MYNNFYISIGIKLALSSFIAWCLYRCYVKYWLIENSTKMVNHSDRQDPQSTTRVYFDSLSGINETRSIFVNDSEIDNINLNPDDKHNVHNVSIVDAIKKRLPALYENKGQVYTFVQVVQQLKDSFRENKSYPYVSRVLRFILESNASYSSRQIKEFEILRLIWTRINHPKNVDQRSILVEELLSQLNDCYQVEEDQIHCLEGRIVRYFQVLELHDFQRELWSLVPLWAYKREIENSCSKALKDMVEGLTIEDQLIYFKKDPDRAEEERVNAWNRNLVERLDSQFKQTYADRLEEQQLKNLIEPCFQAILTF